MHSLEQRLASMGVVIPRILLPSKGVDLRKWSVVACDQHTSEPEYWHDVESAVGSAPSALRLVLPEVYLGAPDESERIERVHDEMERYLKEFILEEGDPGFVLTSRRTPHVARRAGLLLALDLEMYDFTPGATPLIRTTERTIMERIPPRVRVRKNAPLELPHVIVLIDDVENELFGGLAESDLQLLYETELMLGGGRVSGYQVAGAGAEHVAAALESIRSRLHGEESFLFAVGDGNHSLATARVVWDEMKGTVQADHPARYALVELINLYDEGLRFKPIHRLLRVSDPRAWIRKLAEAAGARIEEMGIALVRNAVSTDDRVIGFAAANESGVLRLDDGTELAVEILQEQINTLVRRDRGGLDVDYIHGWDNAVQLGKQSGNLSLMLPDFDPGQLFPTVARRGVLPRKAFSLGESEEKRYYLEARRISPA